MGGRWGGVEVDKVNKVKEEMKNLKNMEYEPQSFGVKMQCKPLTYGRGSYQNANLELEIPVADNKFDEKIKDMKIYICPSCGDSFTEGTDFGNHQKVVHRINAAGQDLEEFCYSTSGTSVTDSSNSTVFSCSSATSGSFCTAEEICGQD